MKKFLVVMLILMVAVPAFARSRTSNTYSSWVSVVNETMTTITFPADSRDILIDNGSAVDVCVSLNGSTFGGSCYMSVASTLHDVMQLGAGQQITLQDFITDSITIRSAAGTASPISVIITY